MTIDDSRHAAIGAEAQAARNSHRKRFKAAVRRITTEVHSLLLDQMVLEELQRLDGGILLDVCTAAVHSDRTVRLIRVLEGEPSSGGARSNEVASFWYLYRCEPKRVQRDADLTRLRALSEKLKLVRDQVAVHIDKSAVYDSEAVYDKADIKGRDLVFAIANLWATMKRLYAEEFPEQAHNAWLSASKTGIRKQIVRELTSM